MRVEWHEVKANKDHVCTRGCAIKRNDFYFQLQSGAGWGGELKVCAACLAMILYFQRVHELPPCVKTHWDVAEKKPVRVDEAPDNFLIEILMVSPENQKKEANVENLSKGQEPQVETPANV